tara:strand:- start:36 stop:2144 length:2109 start_codon:yes stop_codon:yes gene_type:complete
MASLLETKLKIKGIIEDTSIQDDKTRNNLINQLVNQSGYSEDEIINFKLDTETGASIKDRLLIGAAPNYDSQKATLEKKYGEGNVVRYDDTNFAYVDPKNPNTGKIFNPAGFDKGDVAQFGIRPLAQTATNILGATYGRLPGAAYKGAKMALGAGVGETTGGEIVDRGFQLAGGVIDRDTGQHITERLYDFGIGSVSEFVSPVILKTLKMPFRGISPAAKNRTDRNLDLYFRANVQPRTMSLITGSNLTKDLLLGIEYLMSNLPGSRQLIVGSGKKMWKDMSDNIVRTANNLRPSGELILKPFYRVEEITQQGINNAITKFNTKSSGLYDDFFENFNKKLGKNYKIKNVPNFTKLLNEIGTPTGAYIKKDGKIVGQKTGALDFDVLIQLKKEISDKLADEGISINDLKRYRSYLGKHIAAKGAKSDAPLKDLKQLYGALSDDIANITNKIDPSLNRQWNRASNYYRAGKDRIDNIYDTILKKADVDKILNFLQTSGKDGGKYLGGLKKALSEGEFAIVQQELIKKIGTKSVTKQTGMGKMYEEVFDPNEFFKNWQSLSKQAKEYLFSSPKDADLAKNLEILAELSGKMKANPVFKNPEGAGVTQIGQLALVTGTAGGAALALGGLIGLLQTAVGIASVGVVYTRPSIVKWLATASKVAAEGNADKFFKLLGKAGTVFAGESPAVQQAVLDFSKLLLNDEENK